MGQAAWVTIFRQQGVSEQFSVFFFYFERIFSHRNFFKQLRVKVLGKVNVDPPRLGTPVVFQWLNFPWCVGNLGGKKKWATKFLVARTQNGTAFLGGG
jgi:hypothetical protein